MPKKRQDSKQKVSRPIEGEALPEGERIPPPLGEEMIAKLRAAVDAAQRRRMQRQNPATEPEPGD